MGRDALLSCLDKRELLNQSPAQAVKLIEWGARYEEAGLPQDAVDFYERANAADALERLLPAAADEGDAFLFGRILKALGREAAEEEWLAVARRAEELGKLSFAQQAASRLQKKDVPEQEHKGSTGATA